MWGFLLFYRKGSDVKVETYMLTTHTVYSVVIVVKNNNIDIGLLLLFNRNIIKTFIEKDTPDLKINFQRVSKRFTQFCDL